MASQQAYLVIDAGTGNIRVAAVTVTGQLLDMVKEDMQYHKDLQYPDALYFDPDALWEQICLLIAKVLAKAGLIEIIGLLATSQREGIVLLDANSASIIGLPNIDHRGREWETAAQADFIYRLTGRYPGSLFSAQKIIGLQKKQPDVWEKYSTFMSISDWIEYKLSGVIHYEHAQASETLLYDVREQSWSAPLCELFHILLQSLAPLTKSGTVLGHVLPQIATQLSISPSAVVIVGGADTQLAVKSTGYLPGDVIIVSGTTTPVVKITNNYITDDLQRTWTGRHIDNDSFMLEANAGVTGLNYQRLKAIFYPNESYTTIENELQALSNFNCVAALGSVLADEDKPVTRGGFIFNVPVSHLLTRADFVWATLWDMACSITKNYHILQQVSPHQQDYVWACGGGVQSQTFMQLLANLVQKKIVISSNYSQATVMGGVALANQALGYPAVNTITERIIYPQQNDHQATLYHQWQLNRHTLKKAFI